MTPKHRISLHVLTVLILPLFCLGQQKSFQLKANLDPLISPAQGAYKITPKKLTELFPKGNYSKNPYFQWLTKDKSRAIFKRHPAGNVTIDLTILDGKVPVHELIVDFKNGKYLGVVMSVYNRGDAKKSKMTKEQFDASVRGLGIHINTQLATRSQARKGNTKSGLLTSGYSWFSERGMAVLEYNNEAINGQVKFVRLRLCRRDAKGSYAAALKARPAPSVRTSSLPVNVEKSSDGNVYIDNIPMVDQGGKGYCVVASVQRVFEYFGIPCDMHQLAELCNADPDRGTNSLNTAKELGEIDHMFRMRYEVLALRHRNRLIEPEEDDGRFYVTDKNIDGKAFRKIIRKYVDKGMPILWSMQIGLFPEEPAISPQASGGHMRLIIGYNEKEQKVLFSDSWGAGHELKAMKEPDAIKATTGLYILRPINN